MNSLLKRGYLLSRLLFAVVFSLISVSVQSAEIDVLMTKELAGIPDKTGLMLTVEYAPGESSAQHRHNAHTFVYVLEGSVVMGVEGRDPVTLKAGETFYESPDDIHNVSRNASDTEPAKIHVFLIKKSKAPAIVPLN
ncbi:MAG: cupin domain-containing protein [Gammaproteobacteria bacterium]|nr:cupin domain-containing protein [Gammaproteobacteria bacterium]